MKHVVRTVTPTPPITAQITLGEGGDVRASRPISGNRGPVGPQGEEGPPGPEGPAGPPGQTRAIFTQVGALYVGTGIYRHYFTEEHTITGVAVWVATPSSGQAIIVDVNLNGTTIFTDQNNRPTIPAGEYTALTNVPDVSEVVAGDYLTVDLDQVGIGQGLEGADLSVVVLYE